MCPQRGTHTHPLNVCPFIIYVRAVSLGRLWSFALPAVIAVSLVVILVVRNLGGGRVVLIAPPESELVATVDGTDETRVAPNTHANLTLRPGPHRVVLTSSRGIAEHDVDIVDGFTWLLLSSKDQCLELFDITNAYSRSGKPGWLITHLSGGERVALTGNVYFVDREPPTMKDARAQIQLAVDVACR